MRRLALAVVMLVALTTPMLAQDGVPAFSEGYGPIVPSARALRM